MKSPLFYAKILLFGEYGIIKDSKGLAIPYNSFKGSLLKSKSPTNEQKISNSLLISFVEYLKSIDNQVVSLRLNDLEIDLNEGMYFDSSIPQGYGVGSSGALVAAIYDKYAEDKITVLENLTRDKLLKLKTIFGIMESYFHGTSSGLDPLNSYLSIPILIHSKTDLEATGIPSQKEGKAAVFLIDSEQVGETAPMVEIFMEKMKNEGFRNMLKEEFVKHTDASIHDFLKGDVHSLFKNVKLLSKVVLNNFKPMIPEQMQGIWHHGLESDDYYMKLCGSGGGGFFLGFTEDYEKTKTILQKIQIKVGLQILIIFFNEAFSLTGNDIKFIKTDTLDLLEQALLNKKKNAPFFYKFISLFSVVRGHNLFVVWIAQLLSAVFVFAPNKTLDSILFDYKLWILLIATFAVIAAGYIINHFYDIGKDAINRPLKTKIDTFISQETKLKSYFLLNFIGFGLGLFISLRAGLFFAVYVFLIWFYSHKLKRYPLMGLFGASFLSILPFFVLFAYYKNFSEIIFVHASFLFFLLIIKELIKDLENLKGDMLFNYQTIVTKYGEHFTRLLITLVVLLSLIPVYFIQLYPEVGMMKYYFVFALFGLAFIATLIWYSNSKSQYLFLHNVLKTIIFVGVFSLMLIDTSVIINRILLKL